MTKKLEEMLFIFRDKLEGEGIPSSLTILHGIPTETIIKLIKTRYGLPLYSLNWKSVNNNGDFKKTIIEIFAGRCLYYI